jgi:hypothetical protein
VHILKTQKNLKYLIQHLKLLENKLNPKQAGNNNKRAKINKIETKKTMQRVNKTKSSFFEKINKIDKPLANMTKMRREKTQINKNQKKRGRRRKQQTP